MVDNNYFQIERNRRITIAIPGYDPEKQIQKEKNRFSRGWSKHNQKAVMSPPAPVEPVGKEPANAKAKARPVVRTKKADSPNSALPAEKDASNLVLQALHECEPDKAIQSSAPGKDAPCG